jgi:hypothetical protein
VRSIRSRQLETPDVKTAPDNLRDALADTDHLVAVVEVDVEYEIARH